MKQTTKYKLGYFEENDLTSSTVEMQRWETLDAQLYGVFSVLGNGILSGWNLLSAGGLTLSISSGSGHVAFVAVKTDDNTDIPSLVPNTTNYIYALLTETSYWDQSVTFTSFLTRDDDNDKLYLGSANTNSVQITDIVTDDRNYLGFISLIQQIVADHRHIGGTGNPQPIDLNSDVQGVINQSSLPDLDASIITTGILDSGRLPAIDHISNLINQGTLTHAQLDSFVSALSISNATLMGETSTINLLQLILALKHIYPSIDDYLVNEIAYIPGISPDSYVDFENTTAIVDTLTAAEGGEHVITGEAAPGKKAYTFTWDSEAEFKTGTYSNVTIDGDSVELETQQNTLTIDLFSDINDWTVITNDLSSVGASFALDTTTYVKPPNSAKLTIGDKEVEIALQIKKSFDAQDWSEYTYLVFYLKTESVQHGDIYFYLNDNSSGTQNSYIKVLDRNVPTVNIDTLENGWQEFTVNVSAYTRNNINSFGFYVSTQKGWDTSKGFDFNIDNMYLASGNFYKENGGLNLIFGNEFLYDFWRLRWDAIVPTDPDSSGLEFKARTRVGNSLLDLEQSAWSSYSTVSGSDISLPTDALYKYIEIEFYFGASTNLSRSAILRGVFLDYYASDVSNSFEYNTKGDWDSGTKINIDTDSVANSMILSGLDEVDDIIYGSDGLISWRNSSLSELYRITSSALPRSTYQIINNLPPALGLITGISRGNNGSLWFSDTDNDRVIEVDKQGGLLKGFFGSYLVENMSLSATTTTTSTVTSAVAITALSNVSILQVLYNIDKGYLYIIFSRDLSDTEITTLTNQSLRIGSNVFYLDAYTVSKAITGFDNVLKIQIIGANKALLNDMLYTKAPSISIISPYEQQRVLSSVDVKFLLYNFTLGTGIGGNAIRVTLDGVTVQDIYSSKITYTGLSVGLHTIKAQLLNDDMTLNTNIEAIAEGSFVVYSGTYILPYISVITPKPNQIYSSSPIQIEFQVENFPILYTGKHLRYKVDNDAPIDYYSDEPILIDDLDRGKHSVRLYLVDERGAEITGIDYDYISVTVEFIVGLNSLASVKYYCNMNGNITNANVDVANLIFTDVYSPFDVQYILPGSDSDKESILIGKLTNDYINSKIGG